MALDEKDNAKRVKHHYANSSGNEVVEPLWEESHPVNILSPNTRLYQLEASSKGSFLSSPCRYYSTGMLCKKDKKCRFWHDDKTQQRYMSNEAEVDNKRLDLLHNLPGPQYVILVSGFEETHIEGSP